MVCVVERGTLVKGVERKHRRYGQSTRDTRVRYCKKGGFKPVDVHRVESVYWRAAKRELRYGKGKQDDRLLAAQAAFLILFFLV